jgi:hypothetical protein
MRLLLGCDTDTSCRTAARRRRSPGRAWDRPVQEIAEMITPSCPGASKRIADSPEAHGRAVTGALHCRRCVTCGHAVRGPPVPPNGVAEVAGAPAQGSSENGFVPRAQFRHGHSGLAGLKGSCLRVAGQAVAASGPLAGSMCPASKRGRLWPRGSPRSRPGPRRSRPGRRRSCPCPRQPRPSAWTGCPGPCSCRAADCALTPGQVGNPPHNSMRRPGLPCRDAPAGTRSLTGNPVRGTTLPSRA